MTGGKKPALRKGWAPACVLELRWKEPVLTNPIVGCRSTVKSTSQINSVCTTIIHVLHTVSSGNGLDVFPRNNHLNRRRTTGCTH
jgi:hypothetical protein